MCTRVAKRGDSVTYRPPVRFSRSAQRPRFDALACRRQPQRGLQIARAVGEMFSTLRNLLFDRMIDTERSYRGTLLGFRHGVDVTRLLREVALRIGDDRLLQFCDEWLVQQARVVRRRSDARKPDLTARVARDEVTGDMMGG
jgi:hypothetical protein